MAPDPLKRSRQRNGAVTRLPLVMKVTSIVYNPPFPKFLDPPLISYLINQAGEGRTGRIYIFVSTLGRTTTNAL